MYNRDSNAVHITTNFPCGAGKDITEFGPDHYGLVIPSDPPSIPAAKGYDYYFCVCLSNRSSELQTITLDALRPGYADCETKWHATRVPVFISEDLRSWYVLDRVEASENHEEYRCRLAVEPGQTVYLSNSLPYSYQQMSAWLRQVQSGHSDMAELFNLGTTVEDRDILLLTITDPATGGTSKDRVLVSSGFHPAEPDWLATTAIIETLLADVEWARRIRQEFIIDLIVQVNPDGFELGTNACNARGVNLYWDFRPTDRTNSPEAVNLWRWIEKHPPCLYIDFHAYVHQLHKDFRPYIRPLSDYTPLARPVAHAINRRLIALCHGRSVQGRGTNEPTTLAAQITDAFGTITYTKFHLQLNHGIPACRALGVEVFKIIIETARTYRPLTPKVSPGAAELSSPSELWLYWVEQSPAALRLRSQWRRIKRGLDWSSERTSAKLLSGHKERGLDTHWCRHLWSQRSLVSPVIIVESEAGKLQ